VRNDEEPAFAEAVMELAQCGGLPLRILAIHEQGPDGTCEPVELHDGPTPYPCPLRQDALRALTVQAKARSLLGGGPVPPIEDAPATYVPWI
jgi:hypothetical protein